MHVNSLKYVCLYQDDSNTLHLKLQEEPNVNCFFKIHPSLKLQKGRSDNYVYEEEIVYIMGNEKFSGKNPYLCVSNNPSLQEQTVIGEIDDKEAWKVCIYQSTVSEEDS